MASACAVRKNRATLLRKAANGSSILTGPPAPLGLPENLALTGRRCRALRLGNVGLADIESAILDDISIQSSSFGFCASHPRLDSSECPGLPISIGAALPLPPFLCP